MPCIDPQFKDQDIYDETEVFIEYLDIIASLDLYLYCDIDSTKRFLEKDW